MKPMTNLRTSIDLSTWKAMISCQHQEEGVSGWYQDPSPHPCPRPSLPSVTHIQEVVQEGGVFVDDQFLDLEGDWGWGGGTPHKSRVPSVQTAVCGERTRGRPQTDSVRTLALPLAPGPGRLLPSPFCAWGSHTPLPGLLWSLIKIPPGHVLVDSEHVRHTDGAEEGREALQAPASLRLGRHQLPTLLQALLPTHTAQASRHFDLRTGA